MGKVKICKWHIVSKGYDHYLVGYVYNHPFVSDGHLVKTSKLEAINFEDGIVITKNRLYELENF